MERERTLSFSEINNRRKSIDINALCRALRFYDIAKGVTSGTDGDVNITVSESVPVLSVKNETAEVEIDISDALICDEDNGLINSLRDAHDLYVRTQDGSLIASVDFGNSICKNKDPFKGIVEFWKNGLEGFVDSAGLNGVEKDAFIKSKEAPRFERELNKMLEEFADSFEVTQDEFVEMVEGEIAHARENYECRTPVLQDLISSFQFAIDSGVEFVVDQNWLKFLCIYCQNLDVFLGYCCWEGSECETEVRDDEICIKVHTLYVNTCCRKWLLNSLMKGASSIEFSKDESDENMFYMTIKLRNFN